MSVVLTILSFEERGGSLSEQGCVEPPPHVALRGLCPSSCPTLTGNLKCALPSFKQSPCCIFLGERTARSWRAGWDVLVWAGGIPTLGVFGCCCVVVGMEAAEHVLPVSTHCCWPSTAPHSPKRVKKSQECSPHTGAWTSESVRK